MINDRLTEELAEFTPLNSDEPSFRLVTWALLAWLFFSALALVYIKDLNRRLSRDYQRLQKQYVGLQTEWEKLLLEQGTWTSQERIQWVAQHELNMHMPRGNDIVTMAVPPVKKQLGP